MWVGVTERKPQIWPILYDERLLLCHHHASIPAIYSLDTHQQPIFEWSNIWPPECLLPGFREEFEELCTMTIDITLLVAKACDQFAVEFVEGRFSPTNHLGEYDDSCSTLALFSPIRTLTPCRRRRTSTMAASQLTSALFLDDSPPLPPLSSTFKPVPSFHQSSDPLAGIYIRSRTPEVVKVNIPAGCVAFQTGSALGKMTGGVLKDVPHFVRGPNVGRSTVVKNTLAVFTQPNLGEVVDLKTGMIFGEPSGSLTRSMREIEMKGMVCTKFAIGENVARRRENLGLQMFK